MIRRFIYDNPAPLVIDGTGIQADSETVARTRARQDAVREAMGTKWICHAAHRVYRPMSKAEIERFIANSQAGAEAKKVIAQFRRKA